MGTVYRRGRTWWASYLDGTGTRRRVTTNCTEKRTAERVLRQLETQSAEYRLAGNRSADPIRDHLPPYRDNLTAQGRTKQHIERTVQLIERSVAHAGWQRLGDIDGDGLGRYCTHLIQDRGLGHRTVGATVAAVRGFTRWCCRTGRLPADPTVTVTRPSVRTDRRIRRRMILPEEWTWLRRAVLANDAERNGQTAQERLIQYWLAVETGLRSAELRSLRRADLQLHVPDPHVVVQAGLTKNRQTARQYVSDQLTEQLGQLVKRKMPKALVFQPNSRTEMARVLRADVADARRLWLETDPAADAESDFLQSPAADGTVIDFHCLRHTCGAWLAMQGVPLAEVRGVMRHSTITLTVDAYGHLAPDAMARGRNRLANWLA